MVERSFAKEVQALRLGDGETFHGEAILAVAKALLQSGVSYVGGYQGAPVSHMMDVLNDAEDILDELGVHFEANGSEATAAAMLAASIHYPVRGAVCWKSTVGTNVASDALSNLASGGVTGGTLLVLGEDYGEGASIIQERTHAFAMKSQMWLLDPRPNLTTITEMVEKGFELSEASNTPVMLMLRIRACHVTGSFQTRDNKAPLHSAKNPLKHTRRELEKIILPPIVFAQEQTKIQKRWPQAVDFVKKHQLNEFMDGKLEDTGIILQGGLYNTVLRNLQRLGLADAFGNSDLPLYVLNVTYPQIPDEVLAFCADKTQVLVVEEGQPDFIEQAVRSILHKAGAKTRIEGKSMLPMAGEYTGNVVLEGLSAFLTTCRPVQITEQQMQNAVEAAKPRPSIKALELLTDIPARPAGLCTGCPERPLFSAITQVQQDREPFHISADIGCHSFATLPPFNLGNSIMGYGLSLAGASGIRKSLPHREISVMGDGGFWHNGLTSGVTSAVFNKHDGVLFVVKNGYSAATGGQAIPSATDSQIIARSSANPEERGEHLDDQPIEEAVKGVGVNWVRTVSTYDIEKMKKTLSSALDSKEKGLKVIVAEGECMLNRQRRTRPLVARDLAANKKVVRQRFYVDADSCTGDHACVRLSGCPSLSVRDNPDPLRLDPIAYVDNSCVGCGVCGTNAHSAVLCPSFSRVDIIVNPSLLDRILNTVRTAAINLLQRIRTPLRLSRAI